MSLRVRQIPDGELRQQFAAFADVEALGEIVAAAA
jgi:hypothetical protein